MPGEQPPCVTRTERVRRDNLPPGRMELLDKLALLHQVGANSRLRGGKHPYAVSVSREFGVNNITNDNSDAPV